MDPWPPRVDASTCFSDIFTCAYQRYLANATTYELLIDQTCQALSKRQLESVSLAYFGNN